jgi:hypothetical protein
VCFVSLNFQERLKPAKSSASIRDHPPQLFSQTPRTLHSTRALALTGPALSHRRHGRRARLIHDLRHQVHSLSVGRHIDVPIDTEGAALGAATPYTSTAAIATSTALLVLAMGRLLTLLASRLLLLLLLTLLSGEVFTAKLISVHLTLLAWLLLLAIRVGTVVLVLRGIVHFLLQCSHLLPSHSGPKRVT